MLDDLHPKVIFLTLNRFLMGLIWDLIFHRLISILSRPVLFDHKKWLGVFYATKNKMKYLRLSKQDIVFVRT